jgi:glycosyltransferase involved in cell wall biosynthesis
MRNKSRVYAIGCPFGSYRARALLEFLASSPDYVFHHADPKYLTPNSASFLNRGIFKVARYLDRFYNLYKLAIADVVYVLPMATLSPLEYLVARLLKKNIICEFYISQYDTYVNDRQTVAKGTLAAKKLLAKDRRLVDACNVIIFLNKAEGEYYRKTIGRENASQKSLYIPLATNEKLQGKMPFAHGNSQMLTLCWWGTFIPLHGLDKIIHAAEHLQDMGVNFKLYLFGTSEEKSLPYQKHISDLNLDSYVFIDNDKNFADKSLDNFLVEYCDIAFGNFGDSDKARTVMINKVVEAASMRIPVISQRTKALEEYFSDGESILFCDSSPQAIADKVVEIIGEKDRLKNVAKGAYQLYSRRFTKEAYLDDVTEVLNNVCQSKK